MRYNAFLIHLTYKTVKCVVVIQCCHIGTIQLGNCSTYSNGGDVFSLV